MIEVHVSYLRNVRDEDGKLIGVQHVIRAVDVGDDDIAEVRGFWTRYPHDREHPLSWQPMPPGGMIW